MDLIINGARPVPIDNADQLEAALAKWGHQDGDFAILEDGKADFIQSGIDPRGFIVEVRDGDTASMFRANRSSQQPNQQRDRWSREEAIALLSAYYPSRARRSDVIWEDMHMRTSESDGLPRWFYWLIAVFIGLALFVFNDIYRK
jgi:hypothetical protein